MHRDHGDVELARAHSTLVIRGVVLGAHLRHVVIRLDIVRIVVCTITTDIAARHVDALVDECVLGVAKELCRRRLQELADARDLAYLLTKPATKVSTVSLHVVACTRVVVEFAVGKLLRVCRLRTRAIQLARIGVRLHEVRLPHRAVGTLGHIRHMLFTQRRGADALDETECAGPDLTHELPILRIRGRGTHMSGAFRDTSRGPRPDPCPPERDLRSSP